MLSLGLLGKNIKHSKSKDIYEQIILQDFNYIMFDLNSLIDIPLRSFFSKVQGLSITAPYKKHYLPDVIINDNEIKSLGVINCIKSKKDIYYATNTDYLALKKILIKYQNHYIIILGSGAMSDVVKTIVKNMNSDFLQITSNEIREAKFLNLQKIKSPFRQRSTNRIIINCCSREYIFNGVFNKSDIFYDLNYNMIEHQQISKNLDIQYIDGTELLLEQAKEAVHFFEIRAII